MEVTHPACKECGLWQFAFSWNIAPEFIHWDRTDWPIVVIVDRGPSGHDDVEGRLLSDTGHAEWFRSFLDPLECRVILVGAVRCYPGRSLTGTDNKPGVKQYRTCGEHFLSPLLQEYPPKAILCLGEIAMKTVMGKSAPATVGAAGYSHYTFPDLPIPILITYHPGANEFQDLEDEYCRIFTYLEDLAHDRHTLSEISFTTYTSGDALLQEFSPYQEIAWDVETNQMLSKPSGTSNFPAPPTFWHKGFKLLVASFSAWDAAVQEYKNAILLGEDLHSPDFWKGLAQGRILEGHNVKYDLNAVYAVTGVAMEESAKLIRDTLGLAYLTDQCRIGNGLDRLGIMHLGLHDWSEPISAYLEECKMRLRKYADYLRGLEAECLRKIRQLQKKHESLTTKLPHAKKNREQLQEQLEQIERDIPAIQESLAFIQEKRKEARSPDSVTFEDIPSDVCGRYNAWDAYVTRRLSREVLLPQWQGRDQVTLELYRRMLYLTSYVERVGLPLDYKALSAYKQKVHDRQEELYNELLTYDEVILALSQVTNFVKNMHKMTWPMLKKCMSPKARHFLLALVDITGCMNLIPMTKKGNPQLNAEVLEDLSGGDPDTVEAERRATWTPVADKTPVQLLWGKIFELRKLFDLQSRFLREVTIYSVNGRARTTFSLTKISRGVGYGSGTAAGGTTTGRLASRAMNTQNIAKDTELREMFAAPKGYVLAEADYDRIEPVVLTVVAGIRLWADYFTRKLELYRMIAAQIYHYKLDMSLPDDELRKALGVIPKALRDNAKTRTLAIMYDESVFMFAKRANIPIEEAEEFYTRFDSLFPEINAYKEEQRRKVRNGEPITNLFGRSCIYPLPSDQMRNTDPKRYKRQLNSICRQAVNLPIQSFASDITEWMGYELKQELDPHIRSGDVQFVNLVHDSVWLLIRESAFDSVCAKTKTTMEDMSRLPMPFDIPLTVSLKYGPTLGQMKDLA